MRLNEHFMAREMYERGTNDISIDYQRIECRVELNNSNGKVQYVAVYAM